MLLLLMFRSVLLPLKAVIMNVLSVSAAYGVLVFVFQRGYFSGSARLHLGGFIDSTIPILLFCILFGLSMDYEVFLLSRIREEWLRTHNNRYAVARGLEKTGGVITNAALLFMIVTGSFIFTSMVIMKEIGPGDDGRRCWWTRRSSARCWCPRRCACWAAGTGGFRAASAAEAGALAKGSADTQ